MLKIQKNTDLEDIFMQMIYCYIASKQGTAKKTKLQDFACKLEKEMKAINITFDNVSKLKRKATDEEKEEHAKEYIRAFICMPEETLHQIFEKKKGTKKSVFEKKIGKWYDGFTGGILASKLSSDYTKEKWGKYCTDGTDGKVYLKPYHLIASMQNIRYCPYCNVNKIEPRGPLAGGQLDHFNPKSKDICPVLALCLYNLVPSCGTCNNVKRVEQHFQSPYDSKYKIDKVHFKTKLKAMELNQKVEVNVVISGTEYTSEQLNLMQADEKNEPILNNFVHMHIMDGYDRNEGVVEVREIVNNLIFSTDPALLRSMASISKSDVESVLKGMFGELSEDADLLGNHMGKYKRDLLLDHNIVRNEKGKYFYN